MSKKSADKSALFYDAWVIMGAAPAPVAEYPFDAEIGRKHRFDWAWPAQRVAVEVDGGGYAFRGGRHNSDADREKLNIAASLGWRVYRFSPTQLVHDPAGCVDMVLAGLRI